MNSHSRRRAAFLRMFAQAFLVFATLLAANHAQAQAYPSKPIRIVVPFPAGTSPDIVARYLSQKLGERLGQPLPVDNRAGAGGVLGAEAVAKAQPDGYTLFFMANSIVTMNQFIYKKLPYDPVRDFAPVTLIANVPYVLLANKDFPAKSLKEMLAMAKAQPGKVNYASYGVGGAGHVIMELLSSMSGAKLTHIPYKANALADVIGGQVPLILQPTTTAIEQSKKGNVIPLGSTGEKRLALLPNVPTIAEVVPGFAADGWQGMMAPAGTPPAIITRLNQEILAVLALPETAERFASLGIEAWPSSPKQMESTITADIGKWGKVIRDAGIEPQ
jgi:tripartite-type tricarboxylate transporter receptor subunit TctC